MEEVNKKKVDAAMAAAGGDTDIMAIPRKRGRPAKANKLPKKPSSGRGRGRPPKNAASSSAVRAAVDDSGSDDNDGDEVVVSNGRDVQTRDRPLKAAVVVAAAAVAVVPVVKQKSARVEAAAKAKQQMIIKEKSDEDSEELEQIPKTTGGGGGGGGGGRGRPRKNPVAGSTSPVATVSAAVVAAVGTKRSALENGSVAEVPKKRGRPALGLPKTQPKASPKASGSKPRGRPKKPIMQKDDEDMSSEDSSDSFKSAELPNNGGTNSAGRPKPKLPLGNKSRGRPRKLIINKKNEDKTSDDGDDSPDESFKSEKNDNGSSSEDDDESSDVSPPRKVKDKQLTKIITT